MTLFLHIRQLEICIDSFPFHLRVSSIKDGAVKKKKDGAVEMLYLLDMSKCFSVFFFGLNVPKIFRSQIKFSSMR